MGMTILLKRGQKINIGSLTLQEGEAALAYNADKTAVEMYVGDGKGGMLLVNPDVYNILSLAEAYTDEKIDGLVNGAPEAMDTLAELAEAISSNEEIMNALNAAIGNKVNKVDGKDLSSNDYTDAEKEKLEGIAVRANNYTHPSTHPANIITQDATHRFVNDNEKEEWNSKLGSDDVIDGGTF